MKVILKNNHEINVTRTNINYNTKVEDNDKNTITFAIENPEITMDELRNVLTPDSISEIKIVSDTVEIVKTGLKLSTITQSISDEYYVIDIRFSI